MEKCVNSVAPCVLFSPNSDSMLAVNCFLLHNVAFNNLFYSELRFLWVKVASTELVGPDCAKVCQRTSYLCWLDVVLLLECRPCFVWVHLVDDVCGKWAHNLVS